MQRMRKIIATALMAMLPFFPIKAKADLWGADIPLLIEIIVNTAQQLIQLKKILGTGKESLAYIQDINRGIRDALRLARTMNSKLSPGVLSNLETAEQLSGAVETLYGSVPNTPEAQMQKTMDQSVAESLLLHNQAFKYAETVDVEAERIKNHAMVASPQAAEKLTAQSLGVLIHVMNQVLRTNAAILKMNSEQLALNNKKEKLNSQHFKMQYEGLSRAFDDLKPKYDLPRLSKSNGR
jgi:hypothetical protein